AVVVLAAGELLECLVELLDGPRLVAALGERVVEHHAALPGVVGAAVALAVVEPERIEDEVAELHLAPRLGIKAPEGVEDVGGLALLRREEAKRAALVVGVGDAELFAAPRTLLAKR